MDDTRWARIRPEVVFFACDAFFRKEKAEAIADEIRARFGEKVHRTQVYRLITEGRERGYFQLTPPRDQELSRRLVDKFVKEGKRPKVVNVVSRGFRDALDHVAIAAAKTAVEVINDVHRRTTTEPREVHVGFGAGATMMLVARYLAERLRSQATPPPLVLHALSSGFNVAYPATAPTAFFNFFHGIPDVTYRGLFAPAYVRTVDWKSIRSQVGVRESFAEKDSLQVVITSLASSKDHHGELNRFMALNQEIGVRARKILDDEEGRLGDVIYRPFNARGPITRKTEIRAVTLFELEELVEFAADERKAVILVAGPCGDCGRSRSDALAPLLTEPSLAVWSHLVTDDETARNCLEGRPPKEPASAALRGGG
jgi:hypothetical protein